MQRIEIQAGGMNQVATALKSGKLIMVENDVQNVAADLAAIDPGLRLEFDPLDELWIVKHVHTLGDGSVEESLVSSFKECDQRIVQRIREISAPGYDYAAELERIDREAERAGEHAMSEKIGPIAENLAWALRQDLGRHEHPFTRTAKAVVPRAIPKGD